MAKKVLFIKLFNAFHNWRVCVCISLAMILISTFWIFLHINHKILLNLFSNQTDKYLFWQVSSYWMNRSSYSSSMICFLIDVFHLQYLPPIKNFNFKMTSHWLGCKMNYKNYACDYEQPCISKNLLFNVCYTWYMEYSI